MSKYNIHAGHNKSGAVACGAVSLLDESKENRLVKDEVIRLLKSDGHTVYDCTVDNAPNVNANLAQIVTKCNAHAVDLDVSIHFNSGAKDKTGNGATTGTEVWVTASTGIKKTVSSRILANMKLLGFKNRGIKTTGNLYVLNHTKAKAILIEVCFVDDRDDYNLYKKVGYTAVARAIAEGIVGHAIEPKYEALHTMNIRKSASTSSAIVGTLKKGQTITGTPVENNWLKTSKGYIRIKATKTYLKEV